MIPSDPWEEFHFFMARLSRGIPNERNYRQVGATRYGNETVHDTAEQKIELDNRYKPGNLGLWNSRFQRISLKSPGVNLMVLVSTVVAWALAVGALGCGIAAVVLPFFDGRVWKIGTMGWFSGGALLALLAIFLLLNARALAQRS